MAITKQYLKNKPVCKVTFRIPGDIAGDFQSASVVGDFNDWNAEAHKMKKLKKDGSFSLQVNLDKDKEYEFRYLLDGSKWENDAEADKHKGTVYGDSENSVLVL